MSILDPYERRARLQPALIAASPIAIAVVAAGISTHPIVGVVLGGATEIGATVVLADAARRRGKSLEPMLWASWGGAPTTAALRHRGPTEPHRRALVHQALGRLVPDLHLPSAADEQQHPQDADARYDAVTEVARNLLRNEPTGALLAAENKTYGFHRNLLGLRPIGLIVALLTALMALAVVGDAIGGNAPTTAARAAVVAAASLVIAVFWVLYVRPERVRWAADRYADSFISAVLTTRVQNA